MCERYRKHWLESPGPSCVGLILPEWLWTSSMKLTILKIWWLPALESLEKVVKILYSFTRQTEWTALTSLRVFFLNQYKWEWGLGWVVQGRGPYPGAPRMGRTQESEIPGNLFISFCHFTCVHFCGENVCSFNLLQIYQRAPYPVRCLSFHWSRIPSRNPSAMVIWWLQEVSWCPLWMCTFFHSGWPRSETLYFFVSCMASGKFHSPFCLSSHLKKLSSSINILFNTYYLPSSALSTFNWLSHFNTFDDTMKEVLLLSLFINEWANRHREVE